MLPTGWRQILMEIINKMLQAIGKLVPIVLITCLSQVVLALSVKPDSLRYEILLTNKMIANIQINEKFIPSIDITSNQLILLSTSDQFYLLGWGGIVPFGTKLTGNISSYAFTPDSLLMTVSNKELCSFDSAGKLSKLFNLPGEGMGICAGKYVMYIYNRTNSQAKNAFYILAKGGKYEKLFELPTPISSAAETSNSIVFATKNVLFNYKPKTKELNVLAIIPKNKKIKSIALDTLNSRIYYSTDSVIYAYKNSSTVLVTNEIGGVLRFFNDGLIVFNPEKQLLIRIVGIENEVASKILTLKATAPVKPEFEILTNTSIVNLVNAELTDDLIIKIINKSEVNFDLSVDSMILLSDQKVSSAVIIAMKNAMRSKAGNNSNGNK
jgi:hypothetical protein